MTELSGYESIGQLRRLLDRREVAAREVVDANLARIDQYVDLNAFLYVDREGARREAEKLDAAMATAGPIGPLHGVPVAVKDSVDVRGMPTSGGSRIRPAYRPTDDAPVVKALREAGAVVIGKTNLYELGAGDPVFGQVRNPWDPAKSAGASSSGSGAAVAAGLVPVAVGTDSGGSVRLPAAACGVVGLKPTYDRLPRSGSVGGAFSLDGLGFIGRDTMAVAAAFDAATGEATARWVDERIDDGVKALRIGRPRRQPDDRLHPAVVDALDRTARSLAREGVDICDVDVPDLARARAVWFVILMVENAEAFRLEFRDHAAALSDGARWMFGSGSVIPATTYLHAQRVRSTIQRDIAALFRQVDLLLMPTMPIPPWDASSRHVEYDGIVETQLMAVSRYCPLFNLTGDPAIAVPAGFTPDGLPLSIQLAAPALREDLLVRAAAALERVTGWPAVRPEAQVEAP
jgi:aspartyl-tRNA(Asn)/glutamyl-tRNA(Gln) amidotransferase subunit A